MVGLDAGHLFVITSPGYRLQKQPPSALMWETASRQKHKGNLGQVYKLACVPLIQAFSANSAFLPSCSFPSAFRNL